MDQGDAEVLERIASGERVFRPGGSDSARRIFSALVHQLQSLHDRGLINLPDRSVARAADTEGGAFLMAGPCFLTDAGRAALEDYRRGDRRHGERRTGDRRQQPGTHDPGQADRRTADRRRGDRRT
jgi:hypothetical protein